MKLTDKFSNYLDAYMKDVCKRIPDDTIPVDELPAMVKEILPHLILIYNDMNLNQMPIN